MRYTFERCPPPLAHETCCIVRSGAALRAGEEVCNAYNYLTPDLALLQYGFLLPEVQAAAAAAGEAVAVTGGGSGGGTLPPLSIVDAAGFQPADIWSEHAAPPARVSGERGRRQLEAVCVRVMCVAAGGAAERA